MSTTEKKKKRVLKNYFVGDPDGHKRGQDAHGQVHCLVWSMIYEKGEFFAKPDEYSLGVGGGGIGHAKTIEEGRRKLHEYCVQELTRKKVTALDLVRRCQEALDRLGDDPDDLEFYCGIYDEGPHR